MLVQSISQIKNNKIQNNTGYKDISQKTVNNMTLPSYADAKSLVNMSFKARIHDCAESGNWDGIQEELDKGVSVNKPNSSNNTPLNLAIKRKDSKIAERLLLHPDIDVNVQNWHKDTALILASEQGMDDIVEKLIQRPDIDVNAQNVHGSTALMAACRGMSDNTVIAEKLLNRSDIDVNIQNRDKNTA